MGRYRKKYFPIVHDDGYTIYIILWEEPIKFQEVKFEEDEDDIDGI